MQLHQKHYRLPEQVRRANAIKKETSKEEEIEMARTMLIDLDDDDDEDEE